MKRREKHTLEPLRRIPRTLVRGSLLSQNGRLAFFLVLLTLTSFTLRFYRLGNIPNGLTVDEADIGYNAFSILKTGSDVYGRSFPLFFQSLDDYKPGFAIYSAVPLIKIFGLSDFSVRLAAAILGTITPPIIFLLLKNLYPKEKKIAAVASVLIALSPWHIAISRATLMYVELIFFYVLAFVFLVFSLRFDKKFLIISFALLSLTLYVYYAAVFYLPLLILIILILYRKEFPFKQKITYISLLVALIVSLPAIFHYNNPLSKSRLNAISVLTPDVTLPPSIAQFKQDIQKGYPLAKLIHNRRLVYLNSLLNNYFDYFNLDYLFVNSSSTRYFYVNYIGLFYLIEMPFFFFGIYKFTKRREKSDIFILSLLIIGPLPAAITLGSPFPHRGILLLLAIQIISAIGFIEILKLTKKPIKTPILTGTAFLYLLNIIFFLHQYFVHSPNEFTSESDNGAWFSTVRDVIPQINSISPKYEKIVFTWSQNKLVPPVYFLLYNKVDPKIIQSKAFLWTDAPSYKQVYSQIGNIEFRKIDWEQDVKIKNTLFVGYPNEFPKDIEGIVSKTYLPNGTEHFILVQNP